MIACDYKKKYGVVRFIGPTSILPNAYTYTHMMCSQCRVIFRHIRAMQTFMDPYGPQPIYAPYGHIFPLFFIFFIFFLSCFFPKRHYHSPHHQKSYDRLFPSPQHHVCLHPPIFSYLLHILLLFVRTFSP